MRILMIIGLTTLFSLSYGDQEVKEDPVGDDKTEKIVNKRGLEIKDYCRYNNGSGWHVYDCSLPQDDGLGSGKQQDRELTKENSVKDVGYLENTVVMCFGGYIPNKKIKFMDRLENPFKDALKAELEYIEENE